MFNRTDNNILYGATNSNQVEVNSIQAERQMETEKPFDEIHLIGIDVSRANNSIGSITAQKIPSADISGATASTMSGQINQKAKLVAARSRS